MTLEREATFRPMSQRFISSLPPRPLCLRGNFCTTEGTESTEVKELLAPVPAHVLRQNDLHGPIFLAGKLLMDAERMQAIRAQWIGREGSDVQFERRAQPLGDLPGGDILEQLAAQATHQVDDNHICRPILGHWVAKHENVGTTILSPSPVSGMENPLSSTSLVSSSLAPRSSAGFSACPLCL